MPRALRQRSSRPNYAALFQYEDIDGAGPSNQVSHIDDDADSGSDFAPGGGDNAEAEDDDEDDELEDEEAEEDDDNKMSVESDIEGSVVVVQPTAPKGPKKPRQYVSLAPSISTRQLSQAFIVPSTHHRHRAVPLYSLPKGAKVERLASPPQPFVDPGVIPTNSFSEDGVRVRIPRAWSYNVGPGPLWELMEDRAWYSEAANSVDWSESVRRPAVHKNVRINGMLEHLTNESAAPYLPQGRIKCSFGPFGKQVQQEVKPLDTINIDRFFPGVTSHVFSAGGPVWAIDWCPLSPSARGALQRKQYLAVGSCPSTNGSLDNIPRIGVKKAKPACIQIWSLNPTAHSMPNASSGNRGPGFMRCELVLCMDYGPALELKWCPLPSHDDFKLLSQSRKLGLLAGTFGDGSLSIFAVPYPPDVGTLPDASDPVFVKVSEPLLRIELPETSCWSLDWANSEVLAVGCTNGTVAVYNISDILSTGVTLPSHFYNAHQSAIRSLTWVRAPTHSADAEITSDEPTVLISAGYDGILHAKDMRSPCGNDVSRTRDAINTVCFSAYGGGPISIDQGLVKAISFSPVLLNKGHTILDPDGPVWHVGTSEYHPQVACAGADGTVVTTNTMRNTRRGGLVPFLEHRIYQMDYSPKTQEYRMLEHFRPKEVPRVAGTARGPPKGTGAWLPEVGVHRVTWNSGNGLANASWLASATASGLCRVDWLTGRWLNDRIVYEDIEGIRCERETSAQVDDDDEDEE